MFTFAVHILFCKPQKFVRVLNLLNGVVHQDQKTTAWVTEKRIQDRDVRVITSATRSVVDELRLLHDEDPSWWIAPVKAIGKGVWETAAGRADPSLLNPPKKKGGVADTWYKASVAPTFEDAEAIMMSENSHLWCQPSTQKYFRDKFSVITHA